MHEGEDAYGGRYAEIKLKLNVLSKELVEIFEEGNKNKDVLVKVASLYASSDEGYHIHSQDHMTTIIKNTS